MIAALLAYTAAVLRARAEYAAHPFAYCRGADWRGIERIACDGLRRDGDIYCRRHRKAADASNARRRKPREETP